MILPFRLLDISFTVLLQKRVKRYSSILIKTALYFIDYPVWKIFTMYLTHCAQMSGYEDMERSPHIPLPEAVDLRTRKYPASPHEVPHEFLTIQ